MDLLVVSAAATDFDMRFIANSRIVNGTNQRDERGTCCIMAVASWEEKDCHKTLAEFLLPTLIAFIQIYSTSQSY